MTYAEPPPSYKLGMLIADAPANDLQYVGSCSAVSADRINIFATSKVGRRSR
jgi:hypothetical protein